MVHHANGEPNDRIAKDAMTAAFPVGFGLW
jgi:hypothetical protein